MRRSVIYIAGAMGLVVLAALTLPRAAWKVEAGLQAQITSALTDKGLNDIDARVSGQIVTFAYGTDRTQPKDPARLASHMAQAIISAETLPGVLPGQHSYGPLWGPVTGIKIDRSLLDALAGEVP